MADFNEYGSVGSVSETRPGYAEWIALGAVAAGSIGAIVGMAMCTRGVPRTRSLSAPMDPETLTAPHGDKLKASRDM